MPAVKLPGGTFFSGFRGTALKIPTRLSPVSGLLHGQKKEGLSLHMAWNVSPTLLETLNCFERNRQKLSHFLLRFSQTLANLCELFFLHPLTYNTENKPFCLRSTPIIFGASRYLTEKICWNYMPQRGTGASFFPSSWLTLPEESLDSPFVARDELVSEILTLITCCFTKINM